MIRSYVRAERVQDALEAKARDERARYLAGGTYLLVMNAGESAADKPPLSVIDVWRALDGGITAQGAALSLGAGVTFARLASGGDAIPAAIREAAASMTNRNVRSRATVGGNLAALRSCASLAPVLLSLDASLTVASAAGESTVPLADWYERPDGLVLSVRVPDLKAKCGYSRWSRTACDLAVVTAAASVELEGDVVKRAKVACGGLSARPRRFADIDRALEGVSLTSRGKYPDGIGGVDRDELEARIEAIVTAVDDKRGGPALKRRQAAIAVVDAVLRAAGFRGSRATLAEEARA